MCRGQGVNDVIPFTFPSPSIGWNRRSPIQERQNGQETMAKRTLTVAAILLLVSIGSGTLSRSCLAWGDEGHKIIALISERFLNPVARSKVSALLAADPDDLTTHDIASEATWADRYRDSDRLGAKVRYE